MTLSVPEQMDTPATSCSSSTGTILIAIVSASLGIGAGFTCYGAAGSSLGLFFGGVIAAALLVPPLAMATDGWRGGTLNTFAALAGIAWVWAIKGVSQTGTNTGEWGQCCLVLLSFGAVLAMLAAALRSMRIGPVGASAMTIVLGVAWLTWPIWLATQVEGPHGQWLAKWLVPAHPLITVNGLLTHLGTVWNEQNLVYTYLTKLGSEVMYDMPHSSVPTAVFHGGLAMVFAFIALLATGRRMKTRTQ